MREALKQLAAEGIVEHVPYRGVRVVSFSPEDVEDFYTSRVCTEGRAARFAAQQITKRELDELRELHRRMAACVTPRELAAYRDLNRRFHLAIIRASRRPYLVRSLSQLWTAFPTMLWGIIPGVASESVPGRDDPDTAEHEEIIAALAAHDPLGPSGPCKGTSNRLQGRSSPRCGRAGELRLTGGSAGRREGMRTKWSVVVLLLVMLASIAPLLAQSTITGSIEGKVTNEKGSPLEAVTIVVTSPALVKGQASTITDASGSYRFPALPPGTYAVEAQFPGYQNLKQEGARVRARIALAVNFVLPISEVKEEITVTAAAPEVSVVSNTVAFNFGERYIDNQPIPENYYKIIQMAPGVNFDYTSGSGSAMLAYGGTEERQNAFTLDGINVADTGAGQHWVLPSIRWIQEVEVGGLGAAAEFGGYTGGVINAVTKSGGNAFSGDVEFQYQSASWSASNNPDPTAEEEFSFQDYAVSLGGPIVTDKLWFFVSAEYWKQVTTPYKAQASSTREIPRILGKLTWQADDNNRLSLTLEYDRVTNENRGVSEFVLPEASSRQEAPGGMLALHWESVFGSDYFLNVKLSGYSGEDNY